MSPAPRAGGTPDPLIGKRGEVGRQASRLDGAAKVQGQARFSAEVAMEELCYAVLVHATITRGRIVRIVLGKSHIEPIAAQRFAVHFTGRERKSQQNAIRAAVM